MQSLMREEDMRRGGGGLNLWVWEEVVINPLSFQALILIF